MWGLTVWGFEMFKIYQFGCLNNRVYSDKSRDFQECKYCFNSCRLAYYTKAIDTKLEHLTLKSLELDCFNGTGCL